MNKHLFLAPLLMLAVFAAFHRGAEKTITERQAQHEARVEAERARTEAFRAEQARLAAEQTERQIADRAQKDREREAKRVAEHAMALEKLRAEAATHRIAVEQRLASVREAQAGRDTSRAQHASLEASTFTLARDVERLRVQGRSAEIELQRAIAMVTRRLQESRALLQPSPPS